jgi:hypothetical protein
VALLDEAIAAHGGLDRWAQVDEVLIDARAGGAAPTLKFKRRAVARHEVRVSTREPRTVLSPLPGPGRRGVFTAGSVRIETDAGEVVAERRDARSRFPGGRRALWWDHLDLVYFAGYAWWGYVCAPFAFVREGFETRELEPFQERGETWRRLAVTFPPDVPAHSREQVFYFDERGRLRRNDYTAEVFGGWARGAHYAHDHREFDGIVFPTRRRVYPRTRSGRPLPRPVVVRLDLDDVQLVSGARG